jgi:translation initiation factor IF-2
VRQIPQDYINTGGGFNANRSSQVSLGNRPAIVVAKLPAEEEVKTKLETLEKLQGKGGKSKLLNIEEIKRYANRQKSDDKELLTKEVKL